MRCTRQLVEFQTHLSGIELASRTLVPLAPNQKMKHLVCPRISDEDKFGTSRTLSGFTGSEVATRTWKNRICEDVRVRNPTTQLAASLKIPLWKKSKRQAFVNTLG